MPDEDECVVVCRKQLWDIYVESVAKNANKIYRPFRKLGVNMQRVVGRHPSHELYRGENSMKPMGPRIA